MDIVVSLVKPVVNEGVLSVEWAAGGTLPSGQAVAIGGMVPVDWTWTRATFRAALQTVVRDAIAGAYGLAPITSGRFICLELVG